MAFVLPSTQVSGGVNVVVRHASILRKNGADVTLFSMDDKERATDVSGLPVMPWRKTRVHARFDRAVATLWSTVDVVNHSSRFASRYYLVQNFETDFYPFGDPRRILANATYNSLDRLKYITISRWCQGWLAERFRKDAAYAPNGIDLALFAPRERDFSGRIRVLVEGNSEDHYKNVDESFVITNQLDPSRFEVWYLSYQGAPKRWYASSSIATRKAAQKTSMRSLLLITLTLVMTRPAGGRRAHATIMSKRSSTPARCSAARSRPPRSATTSPGRAMYCRPTVRRGSPPRWTS